MKPKPLVIFGLGLAVLIFAIGLVINLSQDKSPAGLAQGTSGGPVPSTAAPPATAPNVPATGSHSGSATAAKPSASTPAGPKPAATKTPSSPLGGPASSHDPAQPLEVQSPAPEATKRLLPTSKANTPLVSAPLPKLADASGKLASGYPGESLPPVDRSKIVSSSVSPQDTILQTTLVANSGMGAGAIKAFYQAHFAPLGFGISDAPAEAGSTATWFTRGADKITLTATPVQGGSTYILYGVLHTGE